MSEHEQCPKCNSTALKKCNCKRNNRKCLDCSYRWHTDKQKSMIKL